MVLDEVIAGLSSEVESKTRGHVLLARWTASRSSPIRRPEVRSADADQNKRAGILPHFLNAQDTLPRQPLGIHPCQVLNAIAGPGCLV